MDLSMLLVGALAVGLITAFAGFAAGYLLFRCPCRVPPGSGLPYVESAE